MELWAQWSEASVMGLGPILDLSGLWVKQISHDVVW